MKSPYTCAIAAALFALTSCTRNTTQNAPLSAAKQEAEAEAQLCKDMTQRQAAIQEFPAVTAETPLDQVKSASERAKLAVQEVGQATQKVNDPELLEIQAAFLQLQNTVHQQGMRSWFLLHTPTCLESHRLQK